MNHPARDDRITVGEAPDARKRSTIYDVAASAGVSHQTVSRYVKGYTNIAIELQERIQRAIDELNYRPNTSARALTLQKRQVVGAIWEETAEFGPSRTMRGVIRRAREAGYVIDAFPIDPDSMQEQTASYIETFVRSKDYAGLFVLAPADGLRESIARTALDLPTMVWGEASETVSATGESLAEFGQRLLAEHLAELGHERVQYISGPADWISARHRRQALETALARAGIELSAVHLGDWTAASGYTIMRDSQLHGATAILGANDQVALGAMRAILERGSRVPGDVSIAGFDDIPEAEYLFPALTTVAQHSDTQGYVAMERLIGLMEGTESGESHIPAPELKVRGSTGAPA